MEPHHFMFHPPSTAGASEKSWLPTSNAAPSSQHGHPEPRYPTSTSGSPSGRYPQGSLGDLSRFMDPNGIWTEGVSPPQSHRAPQSFIAPSEPSDMPGNGPPTSSLALASSMEPPTPFQPVPQRPTRPVFIYESAQTSQISGGDPPFQLSTQPAQPLSSLGPGTFPPNSSAGLLGTQISMPPPSGFPASAPELRDLTFQGLLANVFAPPGNPPHEHNPTLSIINAAVLPLVRPGDEHLLWSPRRPSVTSFAGLSAVPQASLDPSAYPLEARNEGPWAPPLSDSFNPDQSVHLSTGTGLDFNLSQNARDPVGERPTREEGKDHQNPRSAPLRGSMGPPPIPSTSGGERRKLERAASAVGVRPCKGELGQGCPRGTNLPVKGPEGSVLGENVLCTLCRAHKEGIAANAIATVNLKVHVKENKPPSM